MSLFCVGPSKALHFPDDTWLMFIGLAGMGFAFSGIFVPSIPEVIETMMADKESFKIGEVGENADEKIRA